MIAKNITRARTGENQVERSLGSARSVLSTIILCLLPFFLAGCAVIGPRSIRAGRMAYAEAINRTQDEQILFSIVKGRYGESATLLAVNGVVANVRFRADVGAEAGFRGIGEPDDNVLTGGIAYEENPTITYAPVEGERYTRQLLSPIPLDLLLLVLRSTAPDAGAGRLLVNRINDLRNPDFLTGTGSEPDPRFTRLLELWSELSNGGALDLVQDTNQGVAFDLSLHPRTREDTVRVAEMLEQLGMPKQKGQATITVIPVFFGIRVDESWKIGITTRSTYNLVEIMRAVVEVPEKHKAAGLTVTYPPTGLAGRDIRIRSSTRRPGGESLAVKYRGYWFWIDETDQKTKTVFRLLRTLWSMSIANAVGPASPPVLTIPVGN